MLARSLACARVFRGENDVMLINLGNSRPGLAAEESGVARRADSGGTRSVGQTVTEPVRFLSIAGVVFGLSSIALVALTKQLGNVLAASQSINSAIGGPLLGLFTAGMLFPQINTTGK